MALKTAQVLMVGTMLAAGNGRLAAETQPPPACAAREALPYQLRPWECRTAAIVTNGRT